MSSNDADNREPFWRIKIVDLDWDITRGHIDELCSKFGKITNIEVIKTRRVGKLALVTFLRQDDAEYAVYRLKGTRVAGYPIRVFPAPVTEVEIERKKQLERDREKRKLENDQKKRPSKTQKKSLRFLAPANTPTNTLNNRTAPKTTPSTTSKQTVSKTNTQRQNQSQNKNNQNRSQNNNQRKRNNSNNNRKGYGFKPKRYQQKLNNDNQNNDGGTIDNTGNKDLNNNDHNRGDRNGDKNSSEGSDDQVELPDFDDGNANAKRSDDRIYRVAIYNRDSKKEKVYFLNETEVNEHFPPRLRKSNRL